MAHRSLWLAAGILTIIQIPAHAADNGYRKLFNGTSLKGWRGDLAHWSVKEGAIVGSTRPKGRKSNTFLIANGSYADFILRVRFKFSTGGSGIQFRSRILGNPKEYRVTGFQADIGGGDLGTFYEEKGRGTLVRSDYQKLKPFIKKNGWNTYEIRAHGNKFELRVNGQVTARYTEKSKDMPRTGLIALQLQAGPPMEIYFKDIEIREIKP